MKLFDKETINAKRKDQTRELTMKNERLVVSLKKILTLQNDIDFDADKAKKVADYQIWCKDLQDKMAKELGNLNAYKKLVEDKKEDYYGLINSFDALEDKILDKREELEKLEMMVVLKKQILEKTHA